MNLYELLGRWVHQAHQHQEQAEREQAAHRKTLELLKDLKEKTHALDQVELIDNGWKLNPPLESHG